MEVQAVPQRPLVHKVWRDEGLFVSGILVQQHHPGIQRQVRHLQRCDRIITAGIVVGDREMKLRPLYAVRHVVLDARSGYLHIITVRLNVVRTNRIKGRQEDRGIGPAVGTDRIFLFDVEAHAHGRHRCDRICAGAAHLIGGASAEILDPGADTVEFQGLLNIERRSDILHRIVHKAHDPKGAALFQASIPVGIINGHLRHCPVAAFGAFREGDLSAQDGALCIHL